MYTFFDNGLCLFVTYRKLCHSEITYRVHFFLNRSPVHWYSKCYQIVDLSAFDSELISLKVCIETIQGLIYKLIMFGIPIRY